MSPLTRISNRLRWKRSLAVTVAFLVLSAGCRHFPDEPKNVQQPLQGSYVGTGNLDGTATNVSMAITGPDSSGHYTGDIGYRGALTPLDSIKRDSTGDTLRFQYTRNSVFHRAWAGVSSGGFALQFTEPTGIPPFRLNREIGGYNMSGQWSGTLYSGFLRAQRNATMAMEQQGSIFLGTLHVYLVQSADLTLSSGAYNRNAFQISGTSHMAGTDYPVSMTGNYVNHDSISGNWQIGANAEIDAGSFDLGRSFQ